MGLEAVTVVRLINGQFRDITIDIPNEILVLDYLDTLDSEPRVVMYKRTAGVFMEDIEMVEKTLTHHRPK